MKPKKTKLLSLLLALVMCLSLTACGGTATTDEPENIPPVTSDTTPVAEEIDDGSWAVYWYLCGSDLETNGGFATTDLGEMMEVQLPENVNVVIQTGGAAAWQNDFVDAGKIQRWLYNSEGLQLLEEHDSANMGEAQTLYEFLDFANANYPADKVAVTFWNHGGGSVSGAAFDELYNNDSLDLAEMYPAAELTVTEETSFGEAPLFDGHYSMVFEMWDAMGNYAYSDAVTFDCASGEIITTVYED